MTNDILYKDPITRIAWIPGISERYALYLSRPPREIKELDDVWISPTDGWRNPLDVFCKKGGCQIRSPQERELFLNLLEILIDNLQMNPKKFIDGCPPDCVTYTDKINRKIIAYMASIPGLTADLARKFVLSGIEKVDILNPSRNGLVNGEDWYYDEVMNKMHLSARESLDTIRDILALKAYCLNPIIVPGPDRIGGP